MEFFKKSANRRRAEAAGMTSAQPAPHPTAEDMQFPNRSSMPVNGATSYAEAGTRSTSQARHDTSKGEHAVAVQETAKLTRSEPAARRDSSRDVSGEEPSSHEPIHEEPEERISGETRVADQDAAREDSNEPEEVDEDQEIRADAVGEEADHGEVDDDDRVEEEEDDDDDDDEAQSEVGISNRRAVTTATHDMPTLFSGRSRSRYRQTLHALYSPSSDLDAPSPDSAPRRAKSASSKCNRCTRCPSAGPSRIDTPMREEKPAVALNRTASLKQRFMNYYAEGRLGATTVVKDLEILSEGGILSDRAFADDLMQTLNEIATQKRDDEAESGLLEPQEELSSPVMGPLTSTEALYGRRMPWPGHVARAQTADVNSLERPTSTRTQRGYDDVRSIGTAAASLFTQKFFGALGNFVSDRRFRKLRDTSEQFELPTEAAEVPQFIHNHPPNVLPTPVTSDIPGDTIASQQEVQRFMFTTLTFKNWTAGSKVPLAQELPEEVLEFSKQYKPTAHWLTYSLTKEDMRASADATAIAENTMSQEPIKMSDQLGEFFEDIIWMQVSMMRNRQEETREADARIKEAEKMLFAPKQSPAPSVARTEPPPEDRGNDYQELITRAQEEATRRKPSSLKRFLNRLRIGFTKRKHSSPGVGADEQQASHTGIAPQNGDKPSAKVSKNWTTFFGIPLRRKHSRRSCPV